MDGKLSTQKLNINTPAPKHRKGAFNSLFPAGLYQNINNVIIDIVSLIQNFVDSKVFTFWFAKRPNGP